MTAETWHQLATTVACDQPQCGHVFAPRIRVRVDVTGESWSMRCPRCSTRYDMVHITPRGLEVRDELDRVRADATLTPEVREAEIVRLQAELAGETTKRSDVDTEDGDGDSD